MRDGCFSRRAKVRDLLWKLFFTAFRAANESAGGVRAPAPPNLETGSDDVIAGSCQHHCTLHSAASNSLLPHPPVVRLLCSCSVIMSELAFCKTFLGAIDSRPIKLSSDYSRVNWEPLKGTNDFKARGRIDSVLQLIRKKSCSLCPGWASLPTRMLTAVDSTSMHGVRAKQLDVHGREGRKTMMTKRRTTWLP